MTVFLLRLAFAGVCTAVDMGIKYSAKFVLEDPDGYLYVVLALVTDIGFFGFGIVISISGVFRVVQSFFSDDYRRYFKSKREVD